MTVGEPSIALADETVFPLLLVWVSPAHVDLVLACITQYYEEMCPAHRGQAYRGQDFVQVSPRLRGFLHDAAIRFRRTSTCLRFGVWPAVGHLSLRSLLGL